MIEKILVVDDSDTARMFLQRCLEAIGFGEAEFFTAVNGKEAVDTLSEYKVDLIVSDLIMPEMDGKQLLQHVKASTSLQDIPFAIVSSAGNAAKEKELKELGAIGVLPKPCSPAELYQLLYQFMQPTT